MSSKEGRLTLTIQRSLLATERVPVKITVLLCIICTDLFYGKWHDNQNRKAAQWIRATQKRG